MLASHCLVYFYRINGLRTVGNHRSPSLCISPSSLGAAEMGITVSESMLFSDDIDKSSNILHHFVCVGLHVPQMS